MPSLFGNIWFTIRLNIRNKRVVDISDVTDSPQGTSKKATIGEIVTAVQSVTSPINQIVINQESDFAMQTASEIFLEDDKVYIAGASFVTTKKINIGKNNQIIAYSPSVVWQSSSAIFFSGLDVGFFKISGLSVGSITGGLTVFNFRDTSPLTSTIEIDGVTGIAENQSALICSTFLNLDNISSLKVTNLTVVDGLGATVGIIFSGTQADSVTIDQAQIRASASLALVVAVFNDRVRINGLSCIGSDPGDIGINGDIANSGNIATGKLATFNNCEFISPITPLDQISETDIRYNFTNCFPVPDTTIDLFVTLTVAQLVTITTIGVFVPIAGGNWTTTTSSKWAVDSDGIATFLSEIPAKVRLEGNLSIEKVGGGGSELLAMRINIDTGSGFPVPPPARSESQSQSGNTSMGTSADLVVLNQNDRVRIEMANLVATSDITVQANAQFLSIIGN